MIDRSEEIVKQLNRLANDRNLPPPTRNKVRDAVQHIKELNLKMADLKSESEAEQLETVT